MKQYLKVLYEIYMKPKHLQSDFARYNAKLIAEAASRGHITSLLSGSAMNMWHITIEGMGFLYEAGFIDQ